MRITRQFLVQKFNYFNQLCFKGTLPEIRLLISSARTRLGTFRYPLRSASDRHLSLPQCSISISNRFDLSENQIDDTIIHEMIHYYLWLNHREDSTPHGQNFMNVMNNINRQHNRSISVSTRNSPEVTSTDTLHQINIVCVTTLSDGTLGLTNCARTCIFDINKAFLHSSRIISIRWFVTSNTWFNRFPRSRTHKIYRLTPDDFNQYFSKAIAYIIRENRFLPLQKSK